jgi:hypothetical protein
MDVIIDVPEVDVPEADAPEAEPGAVAALAVRVFGGWMC